MRIWSIHPKYLDSKGLVALWRETLLAKNVLLGNTTGYKNHPQLIRFKNLKNSTLGINTYLHYVYLEAKKREYSFDEKKIDGFDEKIKINVSNKQIDYEFEHLLKKLQVRDKKKFDEIKKEQKKIHPHPMFEIIPGEVEEWEKELYI